MHSKTRRIAALASAALAVTALGVSTASAESVTVVVTEDDITRQVENTPPTDNWVLYTRSAGNGAFVVGPSTPPLGIGSLQLVTPTGADKVTLFNYDHVATELDAIDEIGYATYRTAGSAQQVAAINIQVDVNGAAPGGFTTLVFEPVYNTAQGTVTSGIWQTWDAYAGGNAIWWSSNPIPSAPNRDTFVSWNTIVVANPDAVIVGGFGVNQGSGNPALTTAVDALSLGSGDDSVTYNFDVDADGDGVADTDPPQSKDECKKDGYKKFNNPTFKNQGECVSYVNANKPPKS